jgi:protein-S-isoprenylcysteine O-methyltransferase Ste14
MLKIPPPIWTLAYVLVAAAISYLAGWPRIPGLPFPPLGIALIIVGVASAVAAAALFRRSGAVLNPTAETNPRLVTTGPYRFTRNPMYLGLVLVSLGIAIWVGAWPMFLAPLASFATTNWVHIPFEEQRMRQQFGAEFDAFTGRVRRWI